MKKNEITTIEDLRDYLTEYCAQNPEEDCIDLIQEICEVNGWTYTDDVDGYYDTDFVTDGIGILYLDGDGYRTRPEEYEERDIVYDGYNVTIKEGLAYYLIDFHTGSGVSIYPKRDFNLEAALKDQVELDKEQLL